MTLLGIQACQDLGLIFFDQSVHKLLISVDPMKEYPDLFDDKLGKLPVTYKISIDPNVDPVVRAPHAMRDRIESELKNMVSLDMLEEISEPTEWVSTMVATF